MLSWSIPLGSKRPLQPRLPFLGVPVTHTLTVTSTNPTSGVTISVSLLDNNNLSGGTTQFARIYNSGAVVTLTAPTTASGNNFSSWTGCDSASGATCTVTMTGYRNVTANYVTPLPPPPPPSITSVSPTFGIQGQTIANFTVNGTNFQSSSTISFSGTEGDFAISYISRTPTQIVASITVAGTATAGPRNVIVTIPGFYTTIREGAFLVLVREFSISVDIRPNRLSQLTQKIPCML
jgi:hypothetical protein